MPYAILVAGAVVQGVGRKRSGKKVHVPHKLKHALDQSESPNDEATNYRAATRAPDRQRLGPGFGILSVCSSIQVQIYGQYATSQYLSDVREYLICDHWRHALK